MIPENAFITAEITAAYRTDYHFSYEMRRRLVISESSVRMPKLRPLSVMKAAVNHFNGIIPKP